MSAGPTERGSPEVTVLLLAFNRQEFVERAVRSVLASTLPRPEFEIVVVKNFVNAEMEAWFREHGVRVLNEPSAPVGAWMAKGFAAAQGRIVCLLNDDDEFEPGKLARVTELFRSDPSLTFVHDRRRLIDASGAPVPVRRRGSFLPRGVVRIVTDLDRVRRISDCFAARAHFYDSCMSFAATVVAARLDTIRRIEVGEDAVVFFCALAHPGTLLLDDQVLTRFRLHGQSTYLAHKTTSAERLDRRPTVALIEQISRGTPAEIAGRLYALGQTFNRFLSEAQSPPPPAATYASLIAAVVRHRIRSQAVLLGLALLGRIAPGPTRRLFAGLRDRMDETVA